MAEAKSDPQLEHYMKQLDANCKPMPAKQHVKLQTYYRTAQQALIQAQTYMKLGDIERGYVFMKRFAYLILHTVPMHKDYRDSRYAAMGAWGKTQVDGVLKELKVIKQSVKDRYYEKLAAHKQASAQAAKTHAAVAAAKARSGAGGAGAGVDAATMRAFDALRISGPSSASSRWSAPASHSHAHHHHDHAVRHARRTTPSAPVSGNKQYLGLRRVVVPWDVPAKFQKIAEPNSNRPPYGFETCGILAGSMHGTDQLKVTHLIIPPQESTANTVAMTDDGEIQLFTYCTTHNLLALGWIHTHPSQKCFLSSVDVHTHCAYQIMMKEAIAIVMAPTDKAMPCGIFHLTEDGLRTVQACKLTGFHEHPSGITIYQACSHVDLKEVPIKVVDMR